MWQAYGVAFAQGHLDRHSTTGTGDSQLVISPALREDGGRTYRCVAHESDSTLTNSNEIQLDVKCQLLYDKLNAHKYRG